MDVPLEIKFRGVEKTEAMENVVREQAAKLERVHQHLTSCRVAVERPHAHETSGSPFHVRIDLRVPPSHELVVKSNPLDHDMHEQLSTIVIATFKTARRSLDELAARQGGRVKTHDEPRAFVVRIFREEGYGFLRTTEGREIYFHRNSVANDDFERVEIGTQVRFEASEGRDGPQASTVTIVDKPGATPGSNNGDTTASVSGGADRDAEPTVA